jgi:CDP-diglyceride synthetase
MFWIKGTTLNAMLWLKKIREKRSDFKWSALSTMTMLIIFNIFPIDKLSLVQRYWHGAIWTLAMMYFLISTIVFGYQLGKMLKAKKPENLLEKNRK